MVVSDKLQTSVALTLEKYAPVPIELEGVWALALDWMFCRRDILSLSGIDLRF